MNEGVRIDKYLWCVRLFKTRSLSAEVCRKGKVRFDGEPVKPSRMVRPDDLFTVHEQGIVKKIRVIALLNNRVGAKLVSEYIEDLTPAAEYEKLLLLNSRGFEHRDRGTGRPTKRERRDIDKLKSDDA